MSNVVEHPNPCVPSVETLLTIMVDLAGFGMLGRVEKLAVSKSPTGDYVVSCLPFFTYGIQLGDHVAAQEPGMMFERVLQGSGLRSLRIAFSDTIQGDSRHQAIHERLVQAKLLHEWHGSGYASMILIRNLAD